MKRLSLFLLFFLLISPVLAQSKPIYNPKILEAPGEIPGPKRVIPQVASKAPWGYAISLANRFYQLISTEEGITQQESLTIKVPNNTVDGKDIEDATVWLTPKFLQDNHLKLVTYIQHMTGNHVNCFYDEDGPSDHRPDERIFAPPAIGWNRMRAVIVLASFMTPAVLPLTHLNLFMEELDEAVTPDNGLPCGTQEENYKRIELHEDGDTAQIYHDNENLQWTADEFCPDRLENYLTCLDQNAGLPEEEKQSCSLVCPGSVVTEYSTNLPAARETVDPRTGRGEDDVCTGYTCSYLAKSVNDSERLKFTHGENTQDHEVHIGVLSGKTTSEHSVYYGEYARQQAMIAKRCSNLSRGAPGFNEANCTFPTDSGGHNASPLPISTPPPPTTLPAVANTSTSAIQSMAQNNGTNTGSVTGSTKDPNFTPPAAASGNIQEAIVNESKLANIPQCVLEMIGELEGAYDGASCQPNECGAKGFFQITTGQCTAQCRSSACPNALALYGKGQDICSANGAAHVAATLLTSVTSYLADNYKDRADLGYIALAGASPTDSHAIITAGNAYFGSNYQFRDFGGCSYGEMVYKHCNQTTNYTCGTFNPMMPGQNGWTGQIR